jgi:hypothetical protein
MDGLHTKRVEVTPNHRIRGHLHICITVAVPFLASALAVLFGTDVADKVDLWRSAEALRLESVHSVLREPAEPMFCAKVCGTRRCQACGDMLLSCTCFGNAELRVAFDVLIVDCQ